MINLAFYSDQIIPGNEAIDQRLLATMASKGLGRRIGCIPSGPEPDQSFFRGRAAYYERLGHQLNVFYDLDAPHSENEGKREFLRTF